MSFFGRFFGKDKKKDNQIKEHFEVNQGEDLTLEQLASIKKSLFNRLSESENSDELYRRFIDYTDTKSTYKITYRNEHGEAIPFKEWARAIDQATLINAYLYWQECYESQLAFVSKDGLSLEVPSILLVNVSSSILERSGFASLGNIDTRLSIEGEAYTDSFDIQLHIRLNRQEVQTRYNEEIFLAFGQKLYRYSWPIFILLQVIRQYKAEKKKEDNLEKLNYLWAKCRQVLEASPIRLSLNKRLGEVTLLSAATMSVELNERQEIVPVFLAPIHLKNEEGNFASMITPEQSQVVSDYLNSRKPLMAHIPLGNHTYIFLTDEIQKTVKILRQFMKGSPEKRASFFANPIKLIKESLENEGLETSWVDDVFVETPEFLSDRVKAFGEWSRKTCSFIEPIKTEWFQDGIDRYGVLIGDDYLWVTKEEVLRLVKELKQAQKDNQTSIEFNGQTVLVDNVDFEKLNEILSTIQEEETRKKNESQEGSSSEKSTKSQEKKDKNTAQFGPHLKSNLENLEFIAKKQDREVFDQTITGLKEGYRLYEHQKKCVEWLQRLWNDGVPGALLADDMGLGKTLQSLTFMKWVFEANKKEAKSQPALIIAPTALIQNWKEEALKYYGSDLGEPLVINAASMRELKKMSPSERLFYFNEVKWVIATYETVRDKFAWFSNTNWSLLILDEAQKIKNPTSLLTESIKSIKADFVLTMTGTPVENSFIDLWSIVDAAVPGVMGTAKEFARDYCRADDVMASGIELQSLLTKEKTPDDARDFPQLMMRRLKTDHLKDLPSKTTTVYRSIMPASQRSAYDDILQHKKERAMSGEAGTALEALQHLAACSLYGAKTIEEEDLLTEERIQESARLVKLFEILDEIHRKKEKVLIFVQRIGIQKPLSRALKERYRLDHFPGIINGGKTSIMRQEIVNTFQAGHEGVFDALILTSKSAGVGLTLTNANHVIHLERWWNPAVEDQCSDRVYRLGQKKNVTIHVPLAIRSKDDESSFDVKLNDFLHNKRERNATILIPQKMDSDFKAMGEEIFGE